MIPVPLNDVLEIVPAVTSETRVFLSGTSENIPREKNIVFKAWKLLHDCYRIPAADIYLHKIIPSGAGLGGGSADGAFALKMLNSMFETGLTNRQLEDEAAKLGMDCPFFIRNVPVLASGKGEILEPVNVNLEGYYLALALPPVQISTAEAYNGVVPQQPLKSIRKLIQLPVEKWKNDLVNDFESSVFAKHPVIEALKEELYFMGADYAQMSGSGSAVFGLFRSKPELTGKLKDYFVFETLLGSFNQ